MDELKAKEEQKKEEKLKEVAMSPQGGTDSETKLESRGSISSNKDIDLDTFLLGDFEDEGPGLYSLLQHLIV
jgi:hypothetical protein